MKLERGHGRISDQLISPPSPAEGERELMSLLPRRAFLIKAAMLAAAGTLAQMPAVLRDHGWLEAANASPPDLVHDTLNGAIAFMVPGPDFYSVSQGLSTEEPGGIDAHITDFLMRSLDQAQPAPPPFPSLSVMVSTILNQVAQVVHPSVSGPFSSPFANLSFPEKVAVFGYLESNTALAPLAGLLFIMVALLSYSEAGVFDSQTRKLTGWPVGWTISAYEDAAFGRDELKGYFQNRREVR